MLFVYIVLNCLMVWCNRERQNCHAYTITVSRLLLQSFSRSQSDYFYSSISLSARKSVGICFLHFFDSSIRSSFSYTTQPRNKTQIRFFNKWAKQLIEFNYLHQKRDLKQKKYKKSKKAVLGNTFNRTSKLSFIYTLKFYDSRSSSVFFLR